VVIEFVFPTYTLETVSIDGRTFVRPTAEGFAPLGEPGAPELPQQGMLVGLPPSGGYALEILDAEVSTVTLAHPVAPALTRAPAPAGSPPAQPVFEYAVDEVAYSSNAFSPAAAASVEEVGRMRGHRLARVAFHPVQYNPATGELRITERLRVALRFDWDRTLPSAASQRLRSPAFDEILGGAVVNYDQARAWQIAPQPVQRPETSADDAGALSVGLSAASWMNDAADYIVITHEDFWSAIDPLVARRAQDMSVAKIDVQDIYDEFGSGAVEPEPIRAFIEYAYTNWDPAPTYVLLVGNGTAGDPPFVEPNKLPPYPYTAIVQGQPVETSADNRFGEVDPGGGLQGLGEYDTLADVLIGRLPVTTAAEATTVVQKILAYEQAEPDEAWNRRHVFVATDDYYIPELDYYIHVGLLEKVYEEYLEHTAWQTRKIYQPAMSRNAFMAQLMDAWQEGALIMAYGGHAHYHAWWDDPLYPFGDGGADGDLFHYSDEVPQLTNGPRYPVAISLTCYTGEHHRPETVVLDEALIRKSGGGAVAVWSSSGEGSPSYHAVLLDGFYEWVFRHGRTGSNGPADVIGWATAYGKLKLIDAYGGSDPDEVVETYHLFGDPAMALNMRTPDLSNDVFLPLVLRNN
jgi:hypothetical protein